VRLDGEGPRKPEGVCGEMQLAQLMQVCKGMSQRMGILIATQHVIPRCPRSSAFHLDEVFIHLHVTAAAAYVAKLYVFSVRLLLS
jgi:hypothetical protein